MTDFTADKLIATYINLRNEIANHEDKIKELKETQEHLTNALLDLCSAENLDSLRTPYGTASRSIRTHYWTDDWERMYSFVKDNDAMHLLEKRLHNGNIKEFLEANPTLLPPGLQAERKFVITVRKPTTK